MKTCLLFVRILVPRLPVSLCLPWMLKLALIFLIILVTIVLVVKMVNFVTWLSWELGLRSR
jgi:hypothetical protein